MADAPNLIDSLATWATQRIAVYADASKVTLNHVANGTYTGDEFAKDMSGAWKRLSDDFTTLLAALPTTGDDGTT